MIEEDFREALLELLEWVASLPPKKFAQMMQFFLDLRDHKGMSKKEAFAIIFNFLFLKNEKFFEVLIAFTIAEEHEFNKKIEMIKLLRLKNNSFHQVKDLCFLEDDEIPRITDQFIADEK